MASPKQPLGCDSANARARPCHHNGLHGFRSRPSCPGDKLPAANGQPEPKCDFHPNREFKLRLYSADFTVTVVRFRTHRAGRLSSLLTSLKAPSSVSGEPFSVSATITSPAWFTGSVSSSE